MSGLLILGRATNNCLKSVSPGLTGKSKSVGTYDAETLKAKICPSTSTSLASFRRLLRAHQHNTTNVTRDTLVLS